MSIALMNIAQQMTARPDHRLSSTASCAEGAGAKWMKCATSMTVYSVSGRSQARAASKSASAASSTGGETRSTAARPVSTSSEMKPV
jgi:hypothetical protein